MDKELLNCPFCGGKAEFKMSKIFGCDAVRVVCKTCAAVSNLQIAGTTAPFSAYPDHVFSLEECKKMAADQWNSRVHVEPADDEGENGPLELETFTKLIKLAGGLGGDIVFMPMLSNAEGLMTTVKAEYTAEEMESLMRLAGRNNIRVIFTPFKTKEGIKYRGDTLKIGIKPDMNFNQYVYNLSHELAHYFLHYDKGDMIKSGKRAEYEEQADRAARLLLAALSV